MSDTHAFRAHRPHQAIRHGRYHSDAPLRCGVRFYDQPMDEPGCTPQYALVYISEGGGVFTQGDGHEWPVRAGDAFQRFPEQQHTIRLGPVAQTHFVAVPAEVFAMMRLMGLPSVREPVLHVGTDHDFVPRHQRLIANLRDASHQRLIATLTHMQQFIIDMHLHALSLEESGGEMIEQACLMLASDFDRPLSMPAVAEELGVGYSTFRRRFRERIGMPPGDYRVRRRIERAQEMLLSGDSATAVANALGYTDLYAFSAQFKKITGLSPRQFLRGQG